MNDIEKDAARYRWLRDTQNMDFRWDDEWETVGLIENIMVCEGYGTGSSPSPEELDALVEAAMEKNPCQS